MLLLAVPMRGDPSDLFDVFKSNILPYMLPDANYFVQTVPSAKYLAVAKNRNAYILFDDFDKCRKYDTLFICAPFGPIYDITSQACEVALFFEEPEATLCRKQLVKEFRPTFFRIHTGWAFSLDRPATLTAVCPSSSLNKMKQMVNGCGILHTGPNCGVHSKALDTVVDETPLKCAAVTLGGGPSPDRLRGKRLGAAP